MSRKLASIQTIKDIKPIEGADRIEMAQILNWECVVSKGEFNIGDKVIYFEIDSLLPDIPMLEFLKGSSWSQKLNKYKIKTHKMRGQISQGLIMSINSLPTFTQQIMQVTDPDIEVTAVGLDYLPEGFDLTEVLKIEKYEPPVSNGDLGEIISHEWYVPKTDECLAGKTLIDTEQGKIPISKIVNEKMNIRVKSYNENSGKIEYKPVINYFKKSCTKNVVALKSVTTLGRRTNDIICTSNHPFYTNNGLKSAEELSIKDKIYREGINKFEKITKKASPDLVECSILSVAPSSVEHVYNIQVADNENYFANGVLTHNCRIQTCAEDVLPVYMDAETKDWYTTIKLDGTSCTFGLYEDGFYVSGRNQFYKGPNMYTETVKKYSDLETKLKEYKEDYRIVFYISRGVMWSRYSR